MKEISNAEGEADTLNLNCLNKHICKWFSGSILCFSSFFLSLIYRFCIKMCRSEKKCYISFHVLTTLSKWHIFEILDNIVMAWLVIFFFFITHKTYEIEKKHSGISCEEHIFFRKSACDIFPWHFFLSVTHERRLKIDYIQHNTICSRPPIETQLQFELFSIYWSFLSALCEITLWVFCVSGLWVHSRQIITTCT